MSVLSPDARQEMRRAAPYALVMAVFLGGIVGVGAHQSTAVPSEAAPFGWPGIADFDNGVAMVRPKLVLATTLPALVLGATALHAGTRARVAVPTHAAALTAGVFGAGLVGALLADETPFAVYYAFGVAHALLALAFYAIALLWSTVVPKIAALPLAMGTWLYFVGIHDGIFRTILYRTAGYEALNAGQIPAWFYVSQAFSPISTYDAVLMLSQKGFRDYVERMALEQATLPTWATADVFAGLMLVVWVAIPLGLASLVHAWRSAVARPSQRASPRRTT